MTKPSNVFPSILRKRFQRTTFPLAILCALSMFAAQPAQTQTFAVLHDFSGGLDGGNSEAGLTLDAAGNLYGTTAGGGGMGCAGRGCGTVFKLVHRNSSWIVTPIYAFTGGSDGAIPIAQVVFGPDGNLYGTNVNGGSTGNGVVFKLQPPSTPCHSVLCPWGLTVIHSFGENEAAPTGNLTFDPAGNIYGTTAHGGREYGTVYELTPSGGNWTEQVLYTFTGEGDGGMPQSGVILDSAGNLYGTAISGGGGGGAVFKLTHSGSGWTESVLYRFGGGNETSPYGGMVFDQQGNLYGTTQGQGIEGGGTIFQLVPSDGSWTLHILHVFVFDEGWPFANLTMDSAGNIYGTTAYDDGTGADGVAFELYRNGLIYKVWHTFDGLSDGGGPYGSVTLDSSGNMYGTTYAGGSNLNSCQNGCGVAWEITP